MNDSSPLLACHVSTHYYFLYIYINTYATLTYPNPPQRWPQRTMVLHNIGSHPQTSFTSYVTLLYPPQCWPQATIQLRNPSALPSQVIHILCNPPQRWTHKIMELHNSIVLPSEIIHFLCNSHPLQPWTQRTIGLRNTEQCRTLRLPSCYWPPHSLRQQWHKPATYTTPLPHPTPLLPPISSSLLAYKTYSSGKSNVRKVSYQIIFQHEL